MQRIWLVPKDVQNQLEIGPALYSAEFALLTWKANALASSRSASWPAVTIAEASFPYSIPYRELAGVVAGAVDGGFQLGQSTLGALLHVGAARAHLDHTKCMGYFEPVEHVICSGQITGPDFGCKFCYGSAGSHWDIARWRLFAYPLGQRLAAVDVESERVGGLQRLRSQFNIMDSGYESRL
uniref:Uncharacterized protein n=1 Tax=Pristionchus pacificus TaxID=54126 RepID=A0A2A6CXY1_PRIPA|eukprot:PDM83082.1 hypothetical protein PRIPAC_37475 [Pristionchus pacificus]